MTIKEMSFETGISEHSLRLYSREYHVGYTKPHPTREEWVQYFFDEEDIDKVLEIYRKRNFRKRGCDPTIATNRNF
jgi:DNA-binding transcriptional MerR regulator